MVSSFLVGAILGREAPAPVGKARSFSRMMGIYEPSGLPSDSGPKRPRYGEEDEVWRPRLSVCRCSAHARNDASWTAASSRWDYQLHQSYVRGVRTTARGRKRSSTYVPARMQVTAGAAASVNVSLNPGTQSSKPPAVNRAPMKYLAASHWQVALGRTRPHHGHTPAARLRQCRIRPDSLRAISAVQAELQVSTQNRWDPKGSAAANVHALIH